MKVHKIIDGFVVQIFEDGVCISQDFVSDGRHEYETPEGECIDVEEELEYPCYMEQPKKKK